MTTILLSLFALGVGIFLLGRGAEYLIDGGSALALRHKIRPIVIGLTIVAFGTSMPEFVVSMVSAFSGSTDIALGNVVGSNIFNILGILGITALITPLVVQKDTVYKEVPFSLLGAVLVLLLALQNTIDTETFNLEQITANTPVSTLGITTGVILLSQFVIFMYYVFGAAFSQKTTTDNEIDQKLQAFTFRKSIFYILGGLSLLVLGGRATVWGAVAIAQFAGLSEQIIGLTIVAMGTSLPELVTSITAAKKGQDDIAVGNIVGSNIFNIFFILGSSLLISPIPVNGFAIADMSILVAITILLFVLTFAFKKLRIGRTEGAIMFLLYIAYTAYLFVR